MNLQAKLLRNSVINYCARIGADPMLVQGAGGNISWKDDNILWIKASGTWLADARVKNIFVPVDLNELKKSITERNFAVTPKVKKDTPLRPSIETLLHALMPHQVVVHVHAIEPLAYLVRYNAELEIGNKLKTTVPWSIVSYHKPGEALANAVADAIAEKPDTQILLLQNHGVVIGGGDVEEVGSLLTLLVSKLSSDPIPIEAAPTIPEPITIGGDQKYIPFDILDVQNLALNPNLFNRLKTDWALYPDHVVFLGPQPTCYDDIEFLIDDIKGGILPDFFFLKARGVFSKNNFSVAKQIQLQCYYNVLVRQPKDTRLRVLDEQNIAELLNWDAERYRQQAAKHSIV